MPEENELVTNCGCKTCDHKITEVMQEVVDCENSLLRNMDDVEYYLGVNEDTTPNDELRELIEHFRLESDNPEVHTMARHAYFEVVKELEELIDE